MSRPFLIPASRALFLIPTGSPSGRAPAGDPQHLHAQVVGHGRLRHGGHVDRVRPQGPVTRTVPNGKAYNRKKLKDSERRSSSNFRNTGKAVVSSKATDLMVLSELSGHTRS